MGFLKIALAKMGFGPIFRYWVGLIYSTQEVEFFSEVFKSKKFRLCRVVCQGCPLSPLLFNLVIETLAIVVHQQREIKGIEAPTNLHKLLLCADDVVFVL